MDIVCFRVFPLLKIFSINYINFLYIYTQLYGK
jgi:hypothetical protein